MVTEVGREWQSGSAFSMPSYPIQDLLKTPASIVGAALDLLVKDDPAAGVNDGERR